MWDRKQNPKDHAQPKSRNPAAEVVPLPPLSGCPVSKVHIFNSQELVGNSPQWILPQRPAPDPPPQAQKAYRQRQSLRVIQLLQLQLGAAPPPVVNYRPKLLGNKGNKKDNIRGRRDSSVKNQAGSALGPTNVCMCVICVYIYICTLGKYICMYVSECMHACMHVRMFVCL